MMLLDLVEGKLKANGVATLILKINRFGREAERGNRRRQKFKRGLC